MQTSTAATSGPSFDDLSVGYVMWSEPLTVTQTMVNQFAEISGDRNPIHIDEEYARTTPYKSTIAHGALVLALATGQAAQMGIAKLAAIFYHISWEFLRPVRPGDSIKVGLKVAQIEGSSRGHLVTFDVVVKNQREKIVQKGSWVAQVSSRTE